MEQTDPADLGEAKPIESKSPIKLYKSDLKLLGELFQLSYMYRNAVVRTRLLVFISECNLEDKVRKAKALCGKNDWKFIYLEPAIEVLK